MNLEITELVYTSRLTNNHKKEVAIIIKDGYINEINSLCD